MVRKIIEHTLGEISNRRELSIDFTAQHRTHGTHRTHRTTSNTSNTSNHIEPHRTHRAHRTHQNDRAEFNTRLIPRNKTSVHFSIAIIKAATGEPRLFSFRDSFP